MQNRGIFPSIVKNTIEFGKEIVGIKFNTTVYYDASNNIKVVVNEKGLVITTAWGRIKQ